MFLLFPLIYYGIFYHVIFLFGFNENTYEIILLGTLKKKYCLYFKISLEKYSALHDSMRLDAIKDHIIFQSLKGFCPYGSNLPLTKILSLRLHNFIVRNIQVHIHMTAHK